MEDNLHSMEDDLKIFKVEYLSNQLMLTNLWLPNQNWKLLEMKMTSFNEGRLSMEDNLKILKVVYHSNPYNPHQL